jgi:hypothetical protein
MNMLGSSTKHMEKSGIRIPGHIVMAKIKALINFLAALFPMLNLKALKPCSYMHIAGGQAKEALWLSRYSSRGT